MENRILRNHEEKQINSRESEQSVVKNFDRSKAIMNLSTQKLEAVKSLRHKEEVAELSPYEKCLSFVPNENGRWHGDKGNSVFESYNKDVNRKLKEYNEKGVNYKDGIPDFTPFTQHKDEHLGKFDGTVEVTGIKTRKGRLETADQKLASKVGVNEGRIEIYRHNNNFVWHEKGDGKTMQLVPREIHDTFLHMEFQDKESKKITKSKMEYSTAIDMPYAYDSNRKKGHMDNNEKMDGIIRNILDSNVEKQKLPSADRVDWSGKEGYSKCTIKDEAEIKVHDKATGQDIQYTGKQFKEMLEVKYGESSVDYFNKEPNFSYYEQYFDKDDFNVFLDEKYGIKNTTRALDSAEGHTTFDVMPTNREETFRKANYDIAQQMGVKVQDVSDYMKSRNLTWHECGDRKTIRAVPSEINQVFGHTGGIGIQKDFLVLQERLKRLSDNKEYNIVRNSDTYFVETKQYEKMKKETLDNTREIKKELFT